MLFVTLWVECQKQIAALAAGGLLLAYYTADTGEVVPPHNVWTVK